MNLNTTQKLDPSPYILFSCATFLEILLCFAGEVVYAYIHFHPHTRVQVYIILLRNSLVRILLMPTHFSSGIHVKNASFKYMFIYHCDIVQKTLQSLCCGCVCIMSIITRMHRIR